MEGPGTLKLAFIDRDNRAGHPLDRFCPPLPPPMAVAAVVPAAVPLVVPGAVVLDVAAKFIEVGVSSLVDAAAMRMRAEATTLDATIPVDGFYKAGGVNALEGATLVLHNGLDRTAADASFNLSLSFVVSPDKTAFRLRVYIWNIHRFLLPKPRALGQTLERDVLLRIEFLTPGSSGLGTRAAVVELAFPAVKLEVLKTAMQAEQDLPWMPMPPAPASLAAGGSPGPSARFLPFNIRATLVETTRPGLFAKWVEDALVASKATLSKAAATEFRSAFDPVQKLADDSKHLEAGNTAVTAYKKAWDALSTTVAAKPVAPAADATPADVAKYAAALARWRTDAATHKTALSVTRATAVIALHNAGIGWPGDFPEIVVPP